MTGHYQKGFLIPLALLAAALSGVPAHAQTQTLIANPTSLSFPNCIVGSGTISKNVSLTASSGIISFQSQPRPADDRVPWMSISPLNGSTPATATVSVNTNILTAGGHGGSAQFGYVSGGARQLNVSVNVTCTVATPNLTGLNPTQVATGTTFIMTATGSSFQPGITMFVNGQSVSTTFVNSGTATAVIPGSLISTSGNYTVTLQNPGGAMSNALGFGVVGPAFQIQVSALSAFTHTVGAAAPASKTFSYVTTDGGNRPATLSASTQNGGNWLSVQGTGTTPGTATVSVNPTSLAAGNYAGAITVAVSGATNSPVTVGVTLAVSPATTPSLSAAPPSLSFTIQQGAAAQTAQVAVSTSSGNIAFQAATSGAGFSVSPGSGTTPGSVTVTANPAGLSVGAHTGSLSVTAAGTSNSPLAVPLTLTVTAAPTQPISITSGNPSGGTVGVPYSFAFTASGGNGTYSWSVLTGSLPAGLSLSPSGALTGTPTSAGTSSFTVQVADTGGGAPATASVSVTINPAASIQLNLTNQSLSLSAQVNGSASSQSVGYSLSNGSSATISATPFTQSGGGWLAVQLSSGSTPGTATITANPSGLSAGTYGGSVTFTANPPSGPVSASVSVSFTVTGGQQTSALSVSPPSVSIAAAVGAAARTATLNVTSSGSPLIFNATASGGNWLAVSPSGSTTPANLTVTATPGNLAAGTYNGSITIASQDASNSPVTVNVTLTLSAGPATLTANPAQVAFNIALGSGPASQTVALGSTGAPISFSASSIVSQWLSVSPSSGTTPATLTVTVNPATLGLGVHSGAIVVSAPGATNPSLSLNVQVTVATQARPVISQIQQGGSFAPVIAPNTWIVIKGSNLAGTTRVNRPDEIVNGSYPTSMDGVRVSVNGRPAFLYYISPTQLNVAAPDDPAVGSVPVTVTVGAQTSEVATAQMQQFAPGFFLWPGNQVVATSADNFQWRVRPGTFEGAQTVSAQPGEVVVLWGTGFGPTNPPTPAGQVVVNAGFVVNAVRVTVGGTEAEYFGAAMTPDFTALCQVAIRIPANAPDGDLPVVVTMGGISSPTNAVISVRRR